MKRAGIYTRLSLADENSTSTKRQEKDCRDHAKMLGLEVVEVFVDEGISGYRDVERPAFDEAVEALVRGEFDTLIVWKLDRLSRRGMGHIGTLLDRLDGTGRRIVSKMDGIDTSQTQGRIMVALLSEMARSESVNTSVRLKAQRHEARETGRLSVGRPPFGMRRIEDGTIEPDPETAPLAREAVDRYLAGDSQISIVKWLNDSGARTLRGGLWTTSGFMKWITLPSLAGMVSENPTYRQHARPYRHSETGEIVRLGVGLISDAEFWEIQSRKGPERKPTGGKPCSMLRGVLKCGVCGANLHASTDSYYCSTHRTGVDPHRNKISRRNLEAFVANVVISKVCALEPGCDLHEKLDRAWRGDGKDFLEDTESIQDLSRLEDLEGRMATLLEDRYVRGRFDGHEDRFEKIHADLEGMIVRQKAKVSKTTDGRPRALVMDLTDSEVVREAWEATSPEDRNAVIRTVIEKIEVGRFDPTKPRYYLQEDRLEVSFHS